MRIVLNKSSKNCFIILFLSLECTHHKSCGLCTSVFCFLLQNKNKEEWWKLHDVSNWTWMSTAWRMVRSSRHKYSLGFKTYSILPRNGPECTYESEESKLIFKHNSEMTGKVAGPLPWCHDPNREMERTLGSIPVFGYMLWIDEIWGEKSARRRWEISKQKTFYGSDQFTACFCAFPVVNGAVISYCHVGPSAKDGGDKTVDWWLLLN